MQHTEQHTSHPAHLQCDMYVQFMLPPLLPFDTHKTHKTQMLLLSPSFVRPHCPGYYPRYCNRELVCLSRPVV